MRMPRLTVALLALNLVLLGIIWRQHVLLAQRTEPFAAPAQASSSSGPVLASSRSAAAADEENAPSAPPPGNSAPAARTNHPAVDWRQIESGDYRTYIDNLRTVGCPEQTIRDIVSADVMSAFASRRQDALSNLYSGFKYWDSNPSNQVNATEVQRSRLAVDKEMNATLQGLLGQDYVPPDTFQVWKQAELDQQLSFLPSDVRGQTETLLQQYAETDQAVRLLADGTVTPSDPAERQRILQDYDAKRAALSAILTPDQYEQVDMTVSWTADNLRQAMAHFDPSQQEFQNIFQAWRSWDEKLAVLYATGQPDPGNAAVFNQIQQAMSPDRFQKYRQTWWQ
jgi:hypothetical protein